MWLPRSLLPSVIMVHILTIYSLCTPMHSLQKRHWRKGTRDQTHNDNAAYRWQSYKVRTKAEVSLKGEQLKGVAFMAAVLAGFATVSFTQFSYDTTSVPVAVNWMYALTTALSVCFSSCAYSVLLLVVVGHGAACTCLLYYADKACTK